MNSPLFIHIPIAAIGKARARSSPTGHYTPKKTRKYEEDIQKFAVCAMRGRELFTGPVKLTILCMYKLPKSWPAVKRANLLGHGKVTKPDSDNMVKALCDAMNGVVWKDDAQVVELVFCKVYGPWDKIRIEVEETA